MSDKKDHKQISVSDGLYIIQRALVVFAVFCMFFPGLNPGKISALIGKTRSLFTSAISYSALTSEMGRGFDKGWLNESSIVILYVGCLLMLIGLVSGIAGMCFSLGNNKARSLGNLLSICGSAMMCAGLFLVYVSYTQLLEAQNQNRVDPVLPRAFTMYAVLSVILLVSSLILFFMTPKTSKEDRFEIETKYKLFLMFLPFGMLAFAFSYLPLWGWRYAFFNYKAGDTLTMEQFVGFRWFTILLEDKAYRSDIVRVIRNTLAMSGLGLITSWVPMAFAIFLNEIKRSAYKRVIQTVTTIPNFISWVLVYSIALAMFSTDGFINTMIGGSVNYMMSSSHMWLKMLLWGMWKGVGWSAIIYVAGISGIDQQLYEAAEIDGAGRFQKMWYITVPGLAPTYFVMLLMSIANILSNGMDQYLVFANANNANWLEVLDLYVYNLGIGNGIIPLSTVISMLKSLISVILLFAANATSKKIRGESII
jgi:putative aldouronate transport system permease protein